MYGCGFAAFAALLLFTLLSYRQFQQSIGEQIKVWNFARQGWKDGIWHPLVSPTAASETAGRYQYNGDAAIDPASGAGTLDEFHHKLRDISARDIPIGFVFRPLAHFFHLEGDRKHAQRVVFEGSVVKPVVEGDRARMLAPAQTPALPGQTPEQAALREAREVAALVRLEADALTKSGVDAAPASILQPGLTYATGVEPATLDKSFPSISDDFVWTYTKNPAGVWPPTWLPQGSASLAENKPIKAGLDRLFADASTSLQGSEASLNVVRGLRDDLREFRARETRLNELARTDDRTDLDAKMHGRLDELKMTKAAIDAKLKAAHAGGLLKEDSLSKAYSELVDQSKVQSEDAFKIVHDAAAGAGAGPQAKLFPEIIMYLDKSHDVLVARISNSFQPDEVTELASLDALLKDFGDGRRMYEVRTKQYADAEAESAREDDAGSLLGRDWGPLVALRERIDKARAASQATQEMLGGKFDACAYFYDRALERRTGVLATRYVSQTRTAFDQKFGYPLVKGGGGRMNREQLAEAGTLLAEWQKDLKSDNLKLVPNVPAQKLKAFATDTEKLGGIIEAVEANVTIELVGYADSPDKSGLDRLRKVVIDGTTHDTSTAGNIEVGSGSVFNAYRMTFLDYSTGAQESYPLSVDGYELATRTHGNGKVKVTVPRIGLPIFLSVKADRAVPDMNSLPAKQKILADLN